MGFKFAKLCLFFGVVFLYACVSVSPIAPVQNPGEAWQARSDYLLNNEHWVAHLTLLGEAQQQKFKTRVEWKQQADRYKIKLKDFIGRTVAVIDGSPQGVTAKTSKGKNYQGEDADALINELFGIRIPVTGLRYWLQGLPQPGVAPETLVLNDEGLTAAMNQSGWAMTYPHYLPSDPFKMPGQITLNFDDVALNVKVSKWVLTP